MIGFQHSSVFKVGTKDIRSLAIIYNLEKDLNFAFGDTGGFISITDSKGQLINSFQVNNNAVASLQYIKPCTLFSQGALISGGRDGIINIYNIESLYQKNPNAGMVLSGHSSQVCFISLLPTDTLPNQNDSIIILTTAWDSTARIWEINKEKSVKNIVLSHEQFAVWSISYLPNLKQFITAGADQSLRLWDISGQHISTISNAHSKPI